MRLLCRSFGRGKFLVTVNHGFCEILPFFHGFCVQERNHGKSRFRENDPTVFVMKNRVFFSGPRYTYICLPFEMPFREIWYRDGVLQIVVKSTQFGQNLVLFYQNGILMGG